MIVLRILLLSRRNERNKRNFSLRSLCAACAGGAEMKEIKEIFRFALCAQPVPEALSVISFISAGQKNSAGLKIQCAACAEGTFCDFSDFCVPLKNL